MTGVDIFILFVLPAAILIGSLAGLAILNRPGKVAKRQKVDVSYDFSNVIRHPAVGE